MWKDITLSNRAPGVCLAKTGREMRGVCEQRDHVTRVRDNAALFPIKPSGGSGNKGEAISKVFLRIPSVGSAHFSRRHAVHR